MPEQNLSIPAKLAAGAPPAAVVHEKRLMENQHEREQRRKQETFEVDQRHRRRIWELKKRHNLENESFK